MLRELSVCVLVAVLCVHGAPGNAQNKAQSNERNNEVSLFARRTMGHSGRVCTQQGRKCLYDAQCVEQKCICPPGLKGQGLIECVDTAEKVCLVSGDPHLSSFGRSSVDVDLPCRFRAARFLTSNVLGRTKHASCSIEVFATNLMLEGDYVIRSVHVSVGVTDPAMQKHSQFEVYKSRDYDVNDTTIYNYQTRIISRDGIWGSGKYVLDGIVIEPTYDEVNNFAVLEIPHCETRIKYRAFDPARPKHQQQLPGLSIMAPKHAEFIEGLGTYPESVCGTPDDGRLMYQDAAEKEGFVDPETAVIYGIMKDRPAQHDNPNAEKCEAVFNAFEMSLDPIADLNKCSFLVTKSEVASCLGDNNIAPVTVLTACLSMMQSNGVNGCSQLSQAGQLCGDQPGWSGPTTFQC